MKRFGVVFFFLLMLMISVAAGVIYLRGEVLLKFTLEKVGSTLCRCDLEVEKVTWSQKKPFKLGIDNVQFQSSDVNGRISKLSLYFKQKFFSSTHWWFLDIDVRAEGLSLEFETGVAASTTASSSQRKSSRQIARELDGMNWFRMQFHIKDLEVKAKSKNYGLISTHIKKTEIDVNASEDSILWKLEGLIHPPKEFFTKSVPFQSRGKLLKTQDHFELTDASLSLLGIPLILQGQMIIDSGAMNVKVSMEKLDLASVSPEVSKGLFMDWKGLVQFDVDFQKPTGLEPWRYQGKVSVQNFVGQTNYKNGDQQLSGPVKLNMNAEANYTLEEGVRVSAARWDLDLTESSMKIESLFEKAPQIKALTTGEFSYDRGLILKHSSFQLANVDLELDGQIEEGQRTNLNFNVKPFSLIGMEKLLPFLDQYPISGDVEMVGRFSGDIKKPETANLKLTRLLLKDVNGQLDWMTESLKIKGPFTGNTSGVLEVVGKEVRQGQLESKFNLSNMEIQYEKVFHKPAGDRFEFEMSGRQERGRIRLTSGSIIAPFGKLNFEGFLPVPPMYSSDFKVSSSLVQFRKLKSWWPPLDRVIPEGELKGQIHTVGELNLHDIKNSRLETKGEIKMWLPEFTLRDESLSAVKERAVVEGVLPTNGILPSNRVLQSLALVIDAKIGTLRWKNIPFNDMQAGARIEGGKILGRATISKVLDGSVDFSAFEFSLFDPNPYVSFKASLKGIDAAKGIDWFLPPLKQMVNGRLSAEIGGQTRMVTSATFLPDLQCSGHIAIQPANVPVSPFVEVLQKKVRSLITGQSIFSGFQFPKESLALVADFNLAQLQLKLNALRLQSPQGHELELEGVVNFDRTLSFQGGLGINSPTGRGSFFEANQGTDGRIHIPLAISGTPDQPEITIEQDVLREMFQKSQDYQRRRSVSSETENAKTDRAKAESARTGNVGN
jgi:hypothetical protein